MLRTIRELPAVADADASPELQAVAAADTRAVGPADAGAHAEAIDAKAFVRADAATTVLHRRRSMHLQNVRRRRLRRPCLGGRRPV